MQLGEARCLDAWPGTFEQQLPWQHYRQCHAQMQCSSSERGHAASPHLMPWQGVQQLNLSKALTKSVQLLILLALLLA